MDYPTSKNLSLSIRVLAALSIICFVISFPICAQAVEKEENKAYGKKETAGASPFHVRLKPIVAPVNGGGHRSALITVFLQAVSRENIQEICYYRPRIVDTIMQVLSRQPIPVIRRKLDLKNFPAQVLDPINKTLGSKIIWAVKVAPGVVGEKYKNGLFNFSSSSCEIIKANKAGKKKTAATKKSH